MCATDRKNGNKGAERPIISVIVPAYNTTNFIAEAIDSVFAQTFTDFEVIVVNDGSPDTAELEHVLAPYRERIQYFRQENRGLAGARNTGTQHAQGEYLAFLDSDDCWLPDYLASQMKLFEETPSLDVVYSDAWHFGNPALAGKTYMQTCPSKGPVTLESLIREDCQVIASCSVARRQTVVDAGLFDESFRRSEDYDLWLRILYKGGRIAYQKKVLARYRSRPGSLSHNSLKMTEALKAVYEKADRAMDLSEKTRAILRKQLAQAKAYIDLEAGKQFLADGDFGRAKDSLTKANAFFRHRRVRIAILGLQIAPRFFRFVAITWQWLLTAWRVPTAEKSP
jgi:glycosyltransferase involved in cell wall biosynthesis